MLNSAFFSRFRHVFSDTLLAMLRSSRSVERGVKRIVPRVSFGVYLMFFAMSSSTSRISESRRVLLSVSSPRTNAQLSEECGSLRQLELASRDSQTHAPQCPR